MNGPTTSMLRAAVLRLDQGDPALSQSNERWKVDVAREMLATMDTLTLGGQRYVMEKIVRLANDLVNDTRFVHGRRNRAALMGQLDDLAQMSTRTCPEVQPFVQRASVLLALLAATM